MQDEPSLELLTMSEEERQIVIEILRQNAQIIEQNQSILNANRELLDKLAPPRIFGRNLGRIQ